MRKRLWMILALLAMPSLCYAYVGPGIGLTVITSLLALGSAFFITVFGFIWMPIKRFLKGEDSDTENSEEKEDQPDNNPVENTDTSKPEPKENP